MRDGGNLRSLFFPNLEDLHHKGDGVVLFEPPADRFGEHRWGKRTKRFTPFDLGVENSFHIRAPGIAKNRAVAECARSPFGAAIEPAEHVTFSDAVLDTKNFEVDSSDPDAAGRARPRAPSAAPAAALSR